MDVKVEPIGLGLRNGSRLAKFSTLSKRVSHDHMRAAPIADSLEEVKKGNVIAPLFKWGTLTKWKLKEKQKALLTEARFLMNES